MNSEGEVIELHEELIITTVCRKYTAELNFHRFLSF